MNLRLKCHISGYIKIHEGQDGQLIIAEELIEHLTEKLDEISLNPIEVEVKVLIDPREREIEQLKTVNTRISSYST